MPHYRNSAGICSLDRVKKLHCAGDGIAGNGSVFLDPHLQTPSRPGVRSAVNERVAQFPTEHADGVTPPLTSLIGRESEIRALRELLFADETRLITLLGPGGSGKTRLAIAVAAAVIAEDDLRALFVDLTAVRDPDQVLPEIVRLLELGDSEQSLLDSVALAL